MKKLYCIFLLFFLLGSSVFAEEEWLGSIVVKGDNSFEGIEQKISQSSINASNAQNIAEALSNSNPHLLVLSDSNRESLFKLRGFEQKQIVVMLDGVPIYLPYTGTIDLGKFIIEDVSSITIEPSTASILYGPNALGGVVNIQTKKPTRPFALNTWVEFGEYQTYVTGQTISLKNDKFYARISTQGSDTNSYRLSQHFQEQLNQGAGKRTNSDRRAEAISVLLGFTPLQNCEYAFRYSYVEQEYGIPPDAISKRPKYWRFPEWQKQTYSFLSKIKINDAFKIRSNFFYDTYFNVLDAYDDSTYTTQLSSRAFHSTYDDYSYGANIILSYNIAKGLALDWLFNTKYDRHTGQDNYARPWSVFSTWTHSTGFEFKYSLTDRFTFLFASLYEYFDPEEANGAEEKPAIAAFNPQAGFSFDITTHSQVYFKVGQRSRFPTLKELYSDRLGDYRPNPELKEEKALQYNLGYSHHFANNNAFQINLFRSNVCDLIDRVVDATGEYQYQMKNINKAIFQGVELNSLLNFFSSKIEIQPYYQYLYSKNVSEGRVTSDLPYRPRYKLGTDIKWEMLDNFFVYWRVSYVSWQRYENVNVKNDWQTQGGYAKVDLKLEKKINDKVNAWFRIDNLFDRNYEGERGFPMPGRRIFFGFRLNFN